MVKKLQKMAEKKAASAAGLFDSQLAQTVKESAQQIWLAGLGAFAKAQGEGNKLFDTLMKEGLSLHRKTQDAGEKLGDVAERMTAMAGQVGSSANAQWDKLESIFEERTARALGRLGVPTAKDLAALTERLDALADAVARLSGEAAPTPAGRSAAKKSRSRSATAREATATKTTSTRQKTTTAAPRKTRVASKTSQARKTSKG